MWYSTVTDMDFCCVHGKSHDNRGIYLVPYNGVINGKVVKNGYFTGQKIKPAVAKNATTENQSISKKDLFFEKYLNWAFLPI